MSPTFTVTDVGKTVESAAGDTLGAVVEVDDETAYVEPDPEITDSVKAALDWEGNAADAVPLTDDAVAEVTDDAVRLEASFPEDSITTAADTGDESADRDDASGDETLEHSPGEPVASNPTETASDVDETDEDAGTSPTDEGTAETEPEEMEEVEAEASREVEVDPTELTDQDPEADINAEEDVGDRAGADIPDEDREPAGPTTEDAGAIDAEMPTQSEGRPDEEAEGEEHDLDDGR